MKIQVRIAGIFFAILSLCVKNVQASAISTTRAGILDRTFGTGGILVDQFSGTTGNILYDLIVDGRGRMIACGQIAIGDDTYLMVTRLLSSGSVDTTFGTNGYVSADAGSFSAASALCLDAQGRIIVVGIQDADIVIRRFSENGVIDTTFGTSGKTTLTIDDTNSVSAVAVDSQGRIVIAGYTENTDHEDALLVARFTSSGLLDTAGFNATGSAGYRSVVGAGNNTGNALAIDATDQIYVAGKYNSNLIVLKVKSDGTPDTTFGTAPRIPLTGVFIQEIAPDDVAANSIKLDAQGNIYLGCATGVLFGQKFMLVKVTPLGELDTTFGGGAGYIKYTFGTLTGFTGCQRLLVDALGRFIMIGTQQIGGVNAFVAARTSSDGTLDTSFGTNGFVYSTSGDGLASYSAVINNRGSIVMAGIINVDGFYNSYALARYTIGYSLDYFRTQFIGQSLGLVA